MEGLEVVQGDAVVFFNIKAQKTTGRLLDQLNVDQLYVHFRGDLLCNFPGFPDRH